MERDRLNELEIAINSEDPDMVADAANRIAVLQQYIDNYDQEKRDTFKPMRDKASRNIRSQKDNFLRELKSKCEPLSEHLRKSIKSTSYRWHYSPPSDKKIEWDL